MRRVALALLACLTSGCSLATYEYAPCTENVECRDAFGFGWACGDEGFCAEAEVDPRCDTTWPPDLFDRPDKYRDVLPLGAMFSGSVAQGSAVELAVRQANEHGGLDGREYALVTCTYEESYDLDDLDKLAATAHVTRHLADELGVPAIVGPSTSESAEAAYAVAEPLGTLLISPSATSPALSTLDGVEEGGSPGLFWRTVPPDSHQGNVVARDMDNRASRNIAVVYLQDSYGEGLVEVFLADEHAPQFVSFFPYTSLEDLPLAITAAADAGTDEVLFVSSTADDVIGFLNGAAQVPALLATPLFFTDTARNERVLLEAAEAIAGFPGVRGTAPALPTEGQAYEVYTAFLAAYAAMYGAAPDSVYAPHAWDAAWLAMLGTAWAEANEAAIDGMGIAWGLRHVSESVQGEAPSSLGAEGSWEALRAALAAGQGVDVVGASGPLDYYEDDETKGPVEVWKIEAGAFLSEYTVPP